LVKKLLAASTIPNCIQQRAKTAKQVNTKNTKLPRKELWQIQIAFKFTRVDKAFQHAFKPPIETSSNKDISK
jgi:hypothetical protein